MFDFVKSLYNHIVNKFEYLVTQTNFIKYSKLWINLDQKVIDDFPPGGFPEYLTEVRGAYCCY